MFRDKKIVPVYVIKHPCGKYLGDPASKGFVDKEEAIRFRHRNDAELVAIIISYTLLENLIVEEE